MTKKTTPKLLGADPKSYNIAVRVQCGKCGGELGKWDDSPQVFISAIFGAWRTHRLTCARTNHRPK